jgi:hypothetical protein
MIFLRICFFTFCSLITSGETSLAAVGAQFFLNNEERNEMQAGEPVDFKLEMFNTISPEPLHHFHTMHEKPLHLILISEDLESFSHVHPVQLSEHLGIFGIELNQPSNDPYNFDAARAISKAGNYFIFAEAMPMGFSMTTVPLELHARGETIPKKPLVVDPISKDGLIIKEIDRYQIQLGVRTYAHCGTFSSYFEFDLRYKEQNSEHYTDLVDLEPWLASFAHAVMISEEGTSAQAKKFIHFHAVWPLVDDPETERGPYLRIASDGHTPLRQGIYKLWLQFKHRGQVQTLPFVVDIKAPPMNLSCVVAQRNTPGTTSLRYR